MFPRSQIWLGSLLFVWAALVTSCTTFMGPQDPKKIAMLTAAAGGNTGRVKDLIAQGAEANFTDRGLSPLGAAIIAGHLATARTLLESGAIVDLELEDGNRALTIAARQGNVEAVRLLLSFKADPRAKNR